MNFPNKNSTNTCVYHKKSVYLWYLIQIYTDMMTIVLKHSTFSRVTSRLRHDGSLKVFLSLPARTIEDSGFDYLYFHSVNDLCIASDFLSAYNAVYRVADFNI